MLRRSSTLGRDRRSVLASESSASEGGRTRADLRARWMAQAQRGNADAYRALLDDVGPDVVRFLRRRAASPEEVDDLYQETLLALHRARHTYQPPRPVEPWLFAIASHVEARHTRRRRGRLARELLVDEPPDGATEHGGQARLRWVEALERLPPTHREALELVKLEGLSTEAAAARAGTSAGALRVRAHRAYKALRLHLAGQR